MGALPALGRFYAAPCFGGGFGICRFGGVYSGAPRRFICRYTFLPSLTFLKLPPLRAISEFHPEKERRRESFSGNIHPFAEILQRVRAL